MLRDNPNRGEIIRASEGILRLAEVGDRLPTPERDIIEAAELHRGSDDLFADETIAAAPAHLRGAIRALRGKVHAALDRRRREVYINPAITHEGRRRFRAFHEAGHALLPSQYQPAYADDRHTLSRFTNLAHERDANQFASEVMFQRQRFREIAANYEVGIASVIDLANLFHASIHSALHRFVEWHDRPVAAVVLELSPRRPGEMLRRNEALCSPAWQELFERPDCWPLFVDPSVFPWVRTARHASQNPVEWEGNWPDRDNSPTPLRVEAISNGYNLLVLLWRPSRQLLKRRRRLVVPATA
jgi:hypothetical protein